MNPTFKRLDALYDLGENWNGNDVSAPNPDAIELARPWLQSFYDETKGNELPWLCPHVTANEEGSVVLEWESGSKRLSVFFTGTEVWYIKAWGADILDEMTDGTLTTTEDRLAVWSWLQG